MMRQLAYCTNVHAGSDLEAMQANLSRHCLAVKQRFAPEQPMGVGLWLAAPAAKRLLEPPRLAEFALWLAQCGLVPFTLNGFPFGDFHEPVVKHRVYQPTWFDPQRLQYTLDLISILHAILPEQLEGSISTLPIAWRRPEPSVEQLRIAAANLRQVARHLARLEAESGRLIHVCLEPEPGCVLQRCDDVLRFFEEYLCGQSDDDQLLRHLRVCHDVCHSAVMFEDQKEVLGKYARHGVGVGKVQVSSAVEVDFRQVEPGQRNGLVRALSSFAEDRYLHQTSVQLPDGQSPLFYDDLPTALSAAENIPDHQRGVWRVHFHVPIYLECFGMIGTTQEHISRCLQATRLHPELRHFEVETYAWGVLPSELQRSELADGIAQEMRWLAELPEFAEIGSSSSPAS